MATDDFRKDDRELKKKSLQRHMVGFYQEDLKNLDQLVKTNKFGRTRSDVVRAAITYLLEKEGKK